MHSGLLWDPGAAQTGQIPTEGSEGKGGGEGLKVAEGLTRIEGGRWEVWRWRVVGRRV